MHKNIYAILFQHYIYSYGGGHGHLPRHSPTAATASDILSSGSKYYPSRQTAPGHHPPQPLGPNYGHSVGGHQQQQHAYYGQQPHHHHHGLPPHHNVHHQGYGVPPQQQQQQPPSLGYRPPPVGGTGDPIDSGSTSSPPPLYPDAHYGRQQMPSSASGALSIMATQHQQQQRRATREGSDHSSYPARVRIPSNTSIGSSSLGSSVTKMSSNGSIDHHHQPVYYQHQQQQQQPPNHHNRPTPPHIYYGGHYHSQGGGGGGGLPGPPPLQQQQHFQAVGAGLGSNNSVGSKCASPLPIVSVHYILPDGRRVIAERTEDRKPRSGDIRDIDIEKTSEQLGITIEEGVNKGVFVSSVSEHSLASLVGLQVGDQLLDVCGLNLRTSTKEQAALVLTKVGNSIRMKVQFNPDEFQGNVEVNSEEDDDDAHSGKHPKYRIRSS